MLIPHAAPSLQPLHEIDRFFAAPRDRHEQALDAQTEALARLIVACERARPHLYSVDALERFIRMQPDPARVLRRISLALALEQPQAELAYGSVGRGELETFRSVA